MCDMPTSKDSHTQNSCSALQNPYRPRNVTVRNRRNGPHHRPTTKRHFGFNPHHRRPRLHSRRPIPPLLFHSYGPKGSSTISSQRLQVVRSTKQNDLGQRPPFYLSLHK